MKRMILGMIVIILITSLSPFATANGGFEYNAEPRVRMNRDGAAEFNIYVTDVDEYDFFIIDYNIDTINPYNEGVYMIQLRKSSYVGSWGGSWQERMRPGFFIQEMEESDDLEELDE